jgi:Ca2+-binding EF-hand superfamily protein
MGVNLNGVTSTLGRAVLVGALLWSGTALAQGFGPPGFGPPGGGDFRSFDRGRDGDRDRDRDRGDRDSSSSYRSSSSSSSSAVTAPTHVRVTVGLPSTYVDVDADRDGQVGLYEWKKAKRPLAQFTQFDANKDGFLTPRELERAASMPMIASTPTPGSSPAPTGSPSPTAPVASTTTPVISKLSEEDQTKVDEAQAKSVFSILDKNHDGKITAEEIATSTRIGPQFQQAGVSFKEPMAVEQFVSNYVRIQKSKRT